MAQKWEKVVSFVPEARVDKFSLSLIIDVGVILLTHSRPTI